MDSNSIFNNRAVRLTGLTIAITLLLFMVFKLILTLINVTSDDISNGTVMFVSVLSASLLVYKFFANRIA